MKRKKVFLAVLSALMILVAVLLAISVICIYREGLAAKSEDPLAWSFSGEIIAAYFQPIRPLFYIIIGMSAAGLILDVKDENGLKAVKGGMVQTPVSGKWERTIRTVLLIAAVCLLIAGILNGSAGDVFGKAVKICTECVGLG